MNNRQRWQDWFSLILGVWLFISPFIGVGAGSGPEAWNAVIFGALVAVFSIWALANRQRWEEWLNTAFGVWILIAPFVLQFTNDQAALWNHVIVGVLIGADALWAAGQAGSPHHAT